MEKKPLDKRLGEQYGHVVDWSKFVNDIPGITMPIKETIEVHHSVLEYHPVNRERIAPTFTLRVSKAESLLAKQWAEYLMKLVDGK